MSEDKLATDCHAHAHIHISPLCASILSSLPEFGPLVGRTENVEDYRLLDCERLEQRILGYHHAGVEKRLDGMDKRLDDMDKRLDDMKRDVDKRLDGMDKRLDDIQKGIQGLREDLPGLFAQALAALASGAGAGNQQS